jgi:hypothetical protein
MHHACVAFDRLHRLFIACVFLRQLSLYLRGHNPRIKFRLSKALEESVMARGSKILVQKYKCRPSPGSFISMDLTSLKLALWLISVLHVLNELLAEVR